MARSDVDLRTCFVAPFLKITPDLLNDVMRQVIEASAAFIENLNREQLAAGLLADGSPIKPDYTETTVLIKESKGQESDHVTIHDTGAVYEALYTDVFSDSFAMMDDDPKIGQLVAKYSPRLLGLTDESLQKLIVYIKPLYIKVLRQRIGL